MSAIVRTLIEGVFYGSARYQPFTKRGVQLVALNPMRWVLRHWSNNQELGVAIRFDLQIGRRNAGTRVVLVPFLYAQERNFQLDMGGKENTYVLRTRKGQSFMCESPCVSTFVIGGALFIDHFWNHETVEDGDRYAMREAYLLFQDQHPRTTDEYMELRVAALASSIRQRLLGDMKYKAMLNARLLEPHPFYVVDAKNKERAHYVETLGSTQRIKLIDPSLFAQELETTNGSQLFVPCTTAGISGQLIAKAGLLPLADLSYAFV